ncbi:MAG: hypothetical protein ACSHX7_04705 [Luteolibacter sp.]
MKKIGLTILGAIALSSVSCQTTYDAYGTPRKSVDPGVAIAGVAAAGVLGYALSNNDRNRYRNGKHYRSNNYYRSNYHNGYKHRKGNYRRY